MARRKVLRPKKKKNWWDKRIFVLNVDLFNVDVGVAVNCSEADVKRRFRTIKPEFFKQLCGEMGEWDSTPTNVGRMCHAGGGFVILLRPDRSRFREAVGLLVHEMTHVTQYLLRHRRIPMTEDTEEVHAYLTEYLVTAALNKMY